MQSVLKQALICNILQRYTKRLLPYNDSNTKIDFNNGFVYMAHINIVITSVTESDWRTYLMHPPSNISDESFF